MTTFLIKNIETQELAVVDVIVPAEMSAVLAQGDYRVRSVSAEAESVLVVRPAVLEPPVLSSGSTAIGAVLTALPGTFTGVTGASEWRWLTVEDGVIAGATSQTFTITAAEQSKTIFVQQRVGGSSATWASSASIQVASAVVALAANQWNAREALTPTETALPRKQLTTILGVAPPASQIWFYYRGATPPPANPTAGSVAAMTDNGSNNFSAISGGQANIGQTAYSRIARGPADKSSLFWASDTKTWVASGVPDAFNTEADGGQFSLVQGTNPGELIVRISALPLTNGQPITEIMLATDGGSPVSLGGIVEGDYLRTFTEIDPVNPSEHTFTLYATNANGNAPAATLVGRPKAATPAVVVPILTGLAYDSVNYRITQSSDQAGVYHYIVETVSTVRTKEYILANAQGSFAILEGETDFTPNFAALTTGTWYLKTTVQNAAGGLATPQTPLALPVVAPAVNPLAVTQNEVQTNVTYDNSNVFVLPTVAADKLLFVVVNVSNNISSVSLGSFTELTSYRLTNGANTTRFLTKVSDGTEGGTSLSFTTSSPGFSSMHFFAMDANLREIEVTGDITNVYALPAHTPSAGSKEYIFLTGNFQQNGNNPATAAPPGYTGLTVAQMPVTTANNGVHRKSAAAYRIATATTEDPVGSMGSPSQTTYTSWTASVR